MFVAFVYTYAGFIIITGLGAHSRGRSWWRWAILAFLLGPLVLIALLVMRRFTPIPTIIPGGNTDGDAAQVAPRPAVPRHPSSRETLEGQRPARGPILPPLRVRGEGVFSEPVDGVALRAAEISRLFSPATDGVIRWKGNAVLAMDPSGSDGAAVQVIIGQTMVGHLSRSAAERWSEAMRAHGKSGHPAACRAEVSGVGGFSVMLDLPQSVQIESFY